MKKLVKDAFLVSPKCYACDMKAVGCADRTFSPETGLVPACRRHATLRLGALPTPLCIYCSAPTRHDSFDVDGDAAHKYCHREQCSE